MRENGFRTSERGNQITPCQRFVWSEYNWLARSEPSPIDLVAGGLYYLQCYPWCTGTWLTVAFGIDVATPCAADACGEHHWWRGRQLIYRDADADGDVVAHSADRKE